MKRHVYLVVFISVLLLHPCLSHGFDVNGQWIGTITETLNRCDNLGKAKMGDYKLTITHKDNDIVVMENRVKRPYTGVFNPKRPQFAHVHGAYVDGGGYVTELVDIEFENDTTGHGKSVWRWSDGYYSCGGEFSFTLVKTEPQ
jgi:hypothetical protein